MPFSDDLFLCETCEASDATFELIRSSGKHTEDHHLIRCQAPKQDDETTVSTEQRLMSLENRLMSLEDRLDRLNNTHSRIETIEQLLRQLAEAAVGSSRT